jgi:hypothetical protein
VKDKHKSLKPGDLVVLGKVGQVNSMVLWAAWNDMDYTAQEVKFWPAIIGRIKKGEVALVLEICMPNVGPRGAKICVPRNIIGWINCRCLKKLDGDPVET